MYGGGFATIPAYLRDMFGKNNVNAIHGRLLTAWSVAGILGPVLVNYLRKYQIEVRGVPPAGAYSFVLYVMAGLLVIGFIANLLVQPVHDRHFAGRRRARCDAGTRGNGASIGGGPCRQVNRPRGVRRRCSLSRGSSLDFRPHGVSRRR